MYGAANKSLAGTWATLPARILAIAQRFTSVAIENRPAIEVLDVLARTGDGGRNSLIYADPPYLLGSIDPRLYRFGMKSPADHLELLEALDRHRGPVVLSGYPSELYAGRLGHWTTVERSSRNQVNQRRTEVLWLNPVAARQATLPMAFDMAAAAAAS